MTNDQLLRWCIVAACTFLAACEQLPMIQPPTPAYRELALRYNANIDNLDRIWSRATVEMRWEDEHRKLRTEQGDSSQLMAVLPHQLALSVGKLGSALVWIGADNDRYWFIDLTAKPKSAYIGRHESFDLHHAAGPTLMIRPHDVPQLAGWVKLPLTPPGRVRSVRGGYVIEPAGSNVRITVDPRSALPTKIEMRRRDGQVIVASTLRKPGRVEIEGTHVGAWPQINRFIELTSPMNKGWLRLHLSDMTDARGKADRSKRRAIKRAFDFDFLVKAMRVGRVQNLDRAPAPLPFPAPKKPIEPTKPKRKQWYKPQPLPLDAGRPRIITIPPAPRPKD